MALVSISEAARLAGCTRANLYKTYIQTGKLSVTHDHQGKPKVDTAEVLRVFGSLQVDTNQIDIGSQTLTGGSVKIDTHHEMEVKMLLRQLEEAKEREQWYRQQIGELTSTIKLLEHQNSFPFWQKWFK